MKAQARLLVGECREVLRTLPAESVHCCVTSPPYYALRAYETSPQVWGGSENCCHDWQEEIALSDLTGGTNSISGNAKSQPHATGRRRNFCARCKAWRGELGAEPTPELFVEHLVEVFREVRRVLRDDGTLWLNLGDSYASGEIGRHDSKVGRDYGKREAGAVRQQVRPQTSTKQKDLLGIPWQVAFALRADGWYLRSEITWAKASPMPESVRDRPTSATEKVFLLSKSPRYFYDQDAIREPYSAATLPQRGADYGGLGLKDYDGNGVQNPSDTKRRIIESLERNGGRNSWNYWLLGPEPFADAHFATFPTEIPRRALLAGTSEHGCCPTCGAPWRRVVEAGELAGEARLHAHERPAAEVRQVSPTSALRTNGRTYRERTECGWQPTCSCPPAEPVPATILDPFAGSGTTLAVALHHGRSAVGVELNPQYAEIARRRIGKECGLFAELLPETTHA